MRAWSKALSSEEQLALCYRASLPRESFTHSCDGHLGQTPRPEQCKSRLYQEKGVGPPSVENYNFKTQQT